MTSIVPVEYGSGLLAIRQQILEFLGRPIKAVQGTSAAKNLDLAHASPGVIIIGHRAPRLQRQVLGSLGLDASSNTVSARPVSATIGTVASVGSTSEQLPI